MSNLTDYIDGIKESLRQQQKAIHKDILSVTRRLDLLEDLSYSIKEVEEKTDALIRFEAGLEAERYD